MPVCERTVKQNVRPAGRGRGCPSVCCTAQPAGAEVGARGPKITRSSQFSRTCVSVNLSSRRMRCEGSNRSASVLLQPSCTRNTKSPYALRSKSDSCVPLASAIYVVDYAKVKTGQATRVTTAGRPTALVVRSRPTRARESHACRAPSRYHPLRHRWFYRCLEPSPPLGPICTVPLP